MDHIIRDEVVKEKIISAETVLEQCFTMLLDIKHATEALGNAIIEFQPLLGDCLFSLMEFYHELQDEKKTLISQKAAFSPEQFKRYMQTNAKHLRTVSECIKIGKSLGDVNCTPFVRQVWYNTCTKKWGVFLCLKEYQTSATPASLSRR